MPAPSVERGAFLRDGTERQMSHVIRKGKSVFSPPRLTLI